jgi:predicted nucleic acid-binding protein
LTDLIVADAGPLIGLARTNWLWLLERLYRSVLIPPAVRDELEIDAPRPGSNTLSKAIQGGWFRTAEPPKDRDTERLAEILDAGKAEAIMLARARNARLLIDEKRGRAVARRLGVTVIGTGAILLVAKRAQVIVRVSPILDQLADNGYRTSDRLRKEILVLAGED